MLLLDTNVLSELMKIATHPSVSAWIERQIDEPLYTTSIAKAEILAGVATLPGGRRRRSLEDASHRVFENFRGRVVPFDEAVCVSYATILAARQRVGRPIKTNDLIIAAIARANGGTVVTRDVGGFELAGIPIINPWDPT